MCFSSGFYRMFWIMKYCIDYLICAFMRVKQKHCPRNLSVFDVNTKIYNIIQAVFSHSFLNINVFFFYTLLEFQRIRNTVFNMLDLQCVCYPLQKLAHTTYFAMIINHLCMLTLIWHVAATSVGHTSVNTTVKEKTKSCHKTQYSSRQIILRIKMIL